jgi:two-component system sensor histidine kinase KdpD
VQLLLVLVDNASRHSPPGGRVMVTAGEDGRRVASVCVDDQGPGVPPEAREAIFEPFARLPGSRSAADAGSGLGLAIARRIAELHGGTLIATEAPGGGARFVLSLPSGRSAGPATGATGAGVGRGTGAPADDRPAARAPDDTGGGSAIQVP